MSFHGSLEDRCISYTITNHYILFLHYIPNTNTCLVLMFPIFYISNYVSRNVVVSKERSD